MRLTIHTALFAALTFFVCGIAPAQIPDAATLRQAADRGDAEAQLALGMQYAAGEGVPQDHREAVAWYRRAADQGHAIAQARLGLHYAAGRGVPQDNKQAGTWYRRAAGQGGNDVYVIAVLYSTDDAGLGVIRRAADQGYAPAQNALGYLHDTGIGLPLDAREAAVWYRRAADQGLAEAQFNLGMKYDIGNGVPLDDGEAAAWYRRAADLGHPQARYSLGVLYHYGAGVPQDDREAAVWYRRAADLGLAVACNDLGWAYANGTGVGQDDVESYTWFSLASLQGNEDSADGRKDIAGRLSPEERRTAEAEAERRLEAINARLADGAKD